MGDGAGRKPDARAVLMRLWFAYVGAAVAVVVIGLVVGAPAEQEEAGGGLLAMLVILAPAAGYIGLTRRPLTAEDRAALAAEHRQRFFLGVALAESPALFGFVGLFITGSTWVLLAGAAVSLVLLALHAPTPRAIQREDERLRAAGKPVTLSEALSGPAAP
jgi:F0F1-type ATP synthase membrane subunit c/vacuolar-type H+-ATPase subunit K